MKLYYAPVSTYSQKALIALHEKGADFEHHHVNLMDPESREAYRKVYPLGKIPLLVLDDGHLVPESTIIIEYLETALPDAPGLIPDAPEDARQVRFLDRMCDLYLNAAISTLFFQSWKPEDQRDPESIERATFQARTMYDFMEKKLQGNEWLHGEFSMADCAAAPPLVYARELLPYDDHPNVVAYAQRLTARPSFAQILADARPHLEALMAAQA